ncbi:MAG: DNA mismatch repair endonuclease MutL [bacterium]|nr:DNA mismatch repair endonuclease MutL [bacterium]
MPKIRILAENVVNQIAAGEVVERAASVLKELVENSLDAGATRVQIVLKGSGRSLIQVVDDGCGMSRDDLLLAFERHATSKLARAEDLQTVKTLGFRGEALPSIASVSFIEVRSAATGAASGTLLRLEAGRIAHDEPIASNAGTSMAVHSLFFNTPARARFLKSAATELAHLIRIFKQYALAYPEIAWTLTHDDALEYNLPPADLSTRLNDLFGAGFSDKTASLQFEAGGVVVSGVVGLPELNKKSRGNQYLFLNCRPVQSALLHSAVRSALRELLEEGEWPFYAVFLEIAPSELDVNVHPAKLEVKFADEQRVHGALYRAIRSVLTERFVQDSRLAVLPSDAAERSSENPSVAVPQRSDLFSRQTVASSGDMSPLTSGARAPDALSSEQGLLRPAIFQVHGKHLIAQIQSGIAIVDQHAAHERVLFEKAIRSFDERSFHAQQLLFPMLLELDPEMDALFVEVRDDLAKLGFQIRDFGQRTYSVEAVPAGLRRVSESGMIRAMLEEYREFRRARFEPLEALAAGFACHAAIRAGDLLTADEMTALMNELFATRFPLTCPHGRPTVIHVTLSELDRRFKRTE